MSRNYYKNKIKEAIEQAAKRLLYDSGQPKVEYLYLTKEQYEIDPDGWHTVLRQRGLPKDAIVIIPELTDKEVENTNELCATYTGTLMEIQGRITEFLREHPDYEVVDRTQQTDYISLIDTAHITYRKRGGAEE